MYIKRERTTYLTDGPFLLVRQRDALLVRRIRRENVPPIFFRSSCPFLITDEANLYSGLLTLQAPKKEVASATPSFFRG